MRFNITRRGLLGGARVVRAGKGTCDVEECGEGLVFSWQGFGSAGDNGLKVKHSRLAAGDWGEFRRTLV